MAIAVLNWVLEDAPDLPPHCLGVLMALASKAREDGTGARPGQAWLAERSRKSDRAVRNDLATLEDLKLIRRGDQSLVAHLAADERPVVWDLAIERKRASGRNSTSAPSDVSESDDQQVDNGNQKGRKPTTERKSASGRKSTSGRGRKSTSDNTSRDKSTSSPTGKSARKGGAGSESPPNGEKESKHAKADHLADEWWKRYKQDTAQSFLAVRGVIRTAISQGLDRDDVARALDKLGREGTAISGGSLTNAYHDVRRSRDPTSQRNGRFAPNTGARARTFTAEEIENMDLEGKV